MSEVAPSNEQSEGLQVPRAVKWGTLAVLGIICVGAAFLFISRGPAMLLDLGSAIAACF